MSVIPKELWYPKKKVKNQFVIPQPTAKSGTVYIIQIKGTSFFKIGVTKGLAEHRLKYFQTYYPFELNVVHVINCDNAYRLEWSLHQKYNIKRVRGEWFDLSDQDIIEIKNIKWPE